MVKAMDDFVPGTVHLVDLEGTVLAKHANAHQDIVLVPAPSNDPDDPLNWTPRRKLLATSCMCMYTLMVGIASAAIYSILIPISEDTGLSLADLNEGTGYMFLFFGWGCLFWQPLALQYGKRPVYLISILATMAICLWAPYTTTNGQWIANKILQGFFGAPIESLCEVSVTDIYFTHERGSYLALYGLFLAGSNFFAPVIAGFIADGQGWKWVLYWCAIFCGVGFVYIFLLMEETNFSRTTLTGQEMKRDSDSDSPAGTDQKTRMSDKTAPTHQSADGEADHGQALTSTKTLFQKMRLFEPGVFRKSNQQLRMTIRPLIFLTFPIIAYSGFCYGSNLVWFNVLNGTSSLILSNSPYNFRPSMVGLSYVSPLIGVFLAVGYTGKFGDWFMIRMARARGGIMEPEHRLWLFCANAVLVPFGLILWGVGAAQHIHWFGLVLAMCIISTANVIGLQVSLAYCIDTYRDLAGEATITVILIRNTMSFAVGYGITPWVTNMGYQNAFITAAFAGLAQTLTFLVFIRWGKKWRKASREKMLRYVKETQETGIMH